MSDIPLWTWALLVLLLVLSGWFSSAETALFSLTPRQRLQGGKGIQKLFRDPRRLLVSILLGNIVVNVLFFAFAGRLVPGDRSFGDLTVGLGVLLALLVVGDILPKTLGLRASLPLARFAAPILQLLVLLLRPLSAPLVQLLAGVSARFSAWMGEPQGITAEMLSRVMERGAEEGVLLEREADLLAEVVELGDIRVREIMIPRVDCIFLDLDGHDREEAVRKTLAARRSWIPVIDEDDADRVVGRVWVRDLLRRGDRPVRQFVMPVKFVPEVASALDLLRDLRADRTEEAVVIDEWGGTAGCVTAEDVFEEIVGDLRQEGESRTPAAVPLGEGRYRVAGSLSVRDWNEAFGQRVVPWEYETVGGLVGALLGRIPKAGDVARLGHMSMQVHEVRGRRVWEVDVWVEERTASRETAREGQPS
jgi:putative hemolysin